VDWPCDRSTNEEIMEVLAILCGMVTTPQVKPAPDWAR